MSLGEAIIGDVREVRQRDELIRLSFNFEMGIPDIFSPIGRTGITQLTSLLDVNGERATAPLYDTSVAWTQDLLAVMINLTFFRSS